MMLNSDIFTMKICSPVLIFSALIVYVNGTDYTTRFSQEGNNFTVDNEDVMLTRDNDTCVVSFPSGK